MPMLSFRADDEVVGKIDVLRGDLSRSEWVRRAVEAQLGVIHGVEEVTDQPPVRKAEPKPSMAPARARKPVPVDGLHPDDKAIMGYLQARRGSTERLIGQEFGWPGLRVTKAVNRLANAKMVVFPSPGYIRIAEDEAA
jgi:hypothetical protein